MSITFQSLVSSKDGKNFIDRNAVKPKQELILNNQVITFYETPSEATVHLIETRRSSQGQTGPGSSFTDSLMHYDKEPSV